MLGNAAHSVTVTPDMFHRWEDDPQTVKDVEHAAIKLKNL
jgi:hypothetical protein